jgi:hypothetical protein
MRYPPCRRSSNDRVFKTPALFRAAGIEDKLGASAKGRSRAKSRLNFRRSYSSIQQIGIG